MIVLLFLASLSLYLPGPEEYNQRILESDEIEMPYGIYPVFGEEEGLSINMHSMMDTVSYTRMGLKYKYEKKGFGFLVMPFGQYGDGNIYLSGKKFEIYGDVLRGSVYYSGENLNFSFGKDIFSIGPGINSSPVISPGVPLNYLRFIFSTDNFAFMHLIAGLEDYTGPELIWMDTSAGTIVDFERYLAVHRFELRPFDWLGVSFSEIAIGGGEDAGIPFKLISPLSIYYVDQFNSSENYNINWNFDAFVKTGKYLFYIDFLIDDFQYERPDRFREPNHIAFSAGFHTEDLLNTDLQFSTSYRIATRWTYCNFRVWQRYQNYGRPLGFAEGNDFDLFAMSTAYPFEFADLGLRIEFRRKGENRISTAWPVNNYEQNPEVTFTGTNFLSGVVEKRLKVTALFDTGKIKGEIGFYRINNYKNIQDSTLTQPHLKITLNYPLVRL